MTVLEGKDEIDYFVLLSFKGRFQLEINSGLSFKTPTLKAYNNKFGTKFSRRTQALEDVQRRIDEAREARQ